MWLLMLKEEAFEIVDAGPSVSNLTTYKRIKKIQNIDVAFRYLVDVH